MEYLVLDNEAIGVAPMCLSFTPLRPSPCNAHCPGQCDRQGPIGNCPGFTGPIGNNITIRP